MKIKIIQGDYGLRLSKLKLKSIHAGECCEVSQEEARRLIQLGVAKPAGDLGGNGLDGDGLDGNDLGRDDTIALAKQALPQGAEQAAAETAGSLPQRGENPQDGPQTAEVGADRRERTPAEDDEEVPKKPQTKQELMDALKDMGIKNTAKMKLEQLRKLYDDMTEEIEDGEAAPQISAR